MMTRLATLVNDYERNYGDGSGDWLDYYAQLPTLATVIDRASRALGPTGQKHSHQRRVPPEALRRTRDKLLLEEDRLRSCRTFEEIIAIVRGAAAFKFGKLATYDTALRIGAWLKIAPSAVYLHAGTREGACALGIAVNRESIPIEELPRPVQRLDANQIESFLCLYKGDLVNLHNPVYGSPRWSGCSPASTSAARPKPGAARRGC